MAIGRLTVIEGMDVGAVFALDKEEVFVGHHLLECDFYLEDASVARSHARIYRNNGAWYVSDTSEGQGLWLNDGAIEEDTPLKHGDCIQLGESVLRVDLGAGDLESAGGSKLIWIVLGVLLSLAVLLYLVRPDMGAGDGKTNGNNEPGKDGLKVHIPWKGPEYPKTLAPDEKAAQEAYERGLKFYRERAVYLGNGYSALIEFKRVLALTEKLPGDRLPPSRREVQRKDMETNTTKIEELQKYITNNEAKLKLSIKYFEHLHWWKRMAEDLKQYKALFPDKDTEEHRWADNEIRKLRQKGLID